MVVAKRFVFLRHFEGEPKPSDFKLLTEELPPLKDDEVLVEAEFLSVDPYMTNFILAYPAGGTMIGGQVAHVLESKSPDWKVGDRVVAALGWCTHTIFNAKTVSNNTLLPVYKLPDIGDLPSSLSLGMLGMPGNSAYFGLLEICKPKEGETVVVSGAAGAVGSHVGQIAKIKGCRVIGFAGSDDKVKWLTKDLGFDAAFNYKTKDIDQALKEAAPVGVDCYFDNVGGHISNTVLKHMNRKGRISVCGAISSYNVDPSKRPKFPMIQIDIVSKELVLQGFKVSQWFDRYTEGVEENLKWIQEGKLKYKETIVNGFEKMPEALIGMLHGSNTGKAIVQV